MQVQRIAGLKSDLLTNDVLYTRRWYYATPLWYYHGHGAMPRLNTDRTFYNLIDPDLRALCLLLHHYGLRTTPSCQGHFYPRMHYERIFWALRREETLIHTTGLGIFDAETGHGLVVNYHCRVEPALTVAVVHELVDRLEQLVRSDCPEILRIVSHTEPARATA